MRVIADEIRKESYISRNLKGYALDVEMEKGMKIRENQEYHYKKFLFLKKLNKAMEKQDGQRTPNK